MKVDIISFLEQEGIRYWTHGENVTKGWTNICCPFCEDTFNHCGITPNGKYFSCWRCSAKGKTSKLIKKLTGINYAKAKSIVDKLEYLPEEEAQKPTTFAEIPILLNGLNMASKKYLQGRGFNPDYLMSRYGIATVHPADSLKNRIFVPITESGQIVSYTARAYNGKKPKYKSPPGDTLSNIKNYLYLYDEIKNNKSVCIVEGITDAWKIGFRTTAIFGLKMTNEQTKKLINTKIENVYILLDATAQKEADEICANLTPLFPSVEILRLDKGDPAEMDNKDVNEIVNILSE